MLGYYGQIWHNFSLQKERDLSYFPLFALERFPTLCQRATRKALSPKQISLCQEVLTYIQEHRLDLMEHFENNPEWNALIGRPLDTLKWLAKRWNYPPRSAWDLRLALQSAEMFMLVCGT